MTIDLSQVLANAMGMHEAFQEQIEFLDAAKVISYKDLTPERWAIIVENIEPIRNSLELLAVAMKSFGAVDVDVKQLEKQAEQLKNSGVELPSFMQK